MTLDDVGTFVGSLVPGGGAIVSGIGTFLSSRGGWKESYWNDFFLKQGIAGPLTPAGGAPPPSAVPPGPGGVRYGPAGFDSRFILPAALLLGGGWFLLRR